jgi:hypothetical protein
MVDLRAVIAMQGGYGKGGRVKIAKSVKGFAAVNMTTASGAVARNARTTARKGEGHNKTHKANCEQRFHHDSFSNPASLRIAKAVPSEA